jgi:hypothetical protein
MQKVAKKYASRHSPVWLIVDSAASYCLQYEVERIEGESKSELGEKLFFVKWKVTANSFKSIYLNALKSWSFWHG